MAPRSLLMERRDNGEILLRSELPPAAYPRHIGEFLLHWAKADPSRKFLAQRDSKGEWEYLTFGEAAAKADALSQWLIDNGHGGDRPLAALCDNCIPMGLLKLAAMQIGMPFLPISPAYSLMSENFAKLKHVVQELQPSLIYVPSLATFGRALQALDLSGIQILADAPHPDFPKAAIFSEALSAKPSAEVAKRRDAVTPDTIAKILLTSGSTGMPKGVMNTQRMLCANGAAVDQVWKFLTRQPPLLVDWLPWNHTFGTNFNFGQTLRHGGTLYIDAGKPLPGKFETTLKNLREFQQGVLYNVPRGYDMLVPVLEADDDFARHVFGKLQMIFYAGAALPENLWNRLDALSIKHRGKRIPILSSLGSTETAPVAIVTHWPARDFGGVGLPIPGCEIKLVPDGNKLEFRVRGPNVTPGYYRRPDLSALAFDEEGFFMMGDAVAFIDPKEPERGLRFDGRVSENFKLMSGTWVQVGDLRLSAISAAAPAIQDAVVTGHDREEIGLLVFPNLDGCRQICTAPDASLAELVTRPELHAHVANTLSAFNAANPGTSRQVRRVLLMTELPSVDGNEITDKGYINQRAVLQRRAGEVQRLYSDASQPDVVIVPRAEGKKQSAA
jgi:feruloyl-CoA synthase